MGNIVRRFSKQRKSRKYSNVDTVSRVGKISGVNETGLDCAPEGIASTVNREHSSTEG